MSGLVPQSRSAVAKAHYEDALDRARELAKKARADSTWKAYASDWRQFDAWCQRVELPSLPAAPKTIAAFLADQAGERKSPSTIKRRLVAIRLVHSGAGYDKPDDAAVAELMQGIRRDWRRPSGKKAPAVASDVMTMADSVEPETNKGLRDRALLLFGFAGAFRRSELVAIRIEDLAYQDEGVKVTIPHSKTDQDAQGQVIAVPAEADSAYCPVQALKDWITLADISSGEVFLRMHRHDRLGITPMTPQSVALVIKEHALRVGLESAHYAGHSLRRGFLTTAAREDKNIFKMASHSRHKSLEVLRGYVEDEQRFSDHAGEGLLNKDDPSSDGSDGS